MRTRSGPKPAHSYALRAEMAAQHLLGMSSVEVASLYGVSSQYVRNLAYRWRQNPDAYPEITEAMEKAEQDNLKSLQRRIKELEKELEDEKLRRKANELMIDIAEEMFDIPIRKKCGSRQQRRSMRRKK